MYHRKRRRKKKAGTVKRRHAFKVDAARGGGGVAWGWRTRFGGFVLSCVRLHAAPWLPRVTACMKQRHAIVTARSATQELPRFQVVFCIFTIVYAGFFLQPTYEIEYANREGGSVVGVSVEG